MKLYPNSVECQSVCVWQRTQEKIQCIFLGNNVPFLVNEFKFADMNLRA